MQRVDRYAMDPLGHIFNNQVPSVQEGEEAP